VNGKMNMNVAKRPALLDRTLATFLNYGTWLSCAIIALGMALTLVPGSGAAAAPPLGMRIVTAGVALLILLPTARVVLMLVAFARRGERHYSMIAALVLLVIIAGFVLGMAMPGVAA
jgi:uncharacterized membrane protein